MTSNGDKPVSLIDEKAYFENLPANKIGCNKLVTWVEKVKEGNCENLMMIGYNDNNCRSHTR